MSPTTSFAVDGRLAGKPVERSSTTTIGELQNHVAADVPETSLLPGPSIRLPARLDNAPIFYDSHQISSRSRAVTLFRLSENVHDWESVCEICAAIAIQAQIGPGSSRSSSLHVRDPSAE